MVQLQLLLKLRNNTSVCQFHLESKHHILTLEVGGILIITSRNNGEVNKEGEKRASWIINSKNTGHICRPPRSEYPSCGVFGTFQKWLFTVAVILGHWVGHFLTDILTLRENGYFYPRVLN